ncbi:MAG: thiol protease/hemagglutinin PrtT [Bacteroidales bacterium]|nr:thiol protease/hemagglutinin PrtT [Bacteroidales bacterium]MDD4362349.1 thiol protease/hemagglutinin PrtT [Bacteroidales bacterium]
MNALRFFLLIFLMTACASSLFAVHLSPEQAMDQAKIFYMDKHRSLLRAAPELRPVQLKKEAVESKDTNESYYIFNVADNQGFILAAADDRLRPVLAYADAGSFPSEQIPANLQAWLDFYESEIQYLIQMDPDSPVTNNTPVHYSDTGHYVEALLGYTQWDQFYPYNLQCPYSEDFSERTVTGCMATAMAQIMYYHQWPTNGFGSNSYSLTIDSGDRTLSADFYQTYYAWSDMQNVYTSDATEAQKQAVALLMYHCGVAVNMEYNVASQGGSWAYLSDAGAALTKYFRYDTDLQMYTRDFFDYESWSGLIRSELDAGRPVLYRGGGVDGSGHAFVCDGYDSDDFYHINWGWGGYGNGYFSLSTLDPDYQGAGYSALGYSYEQMMLAGIQKPDNTYSGNYQLNMYTNGLSSEISSLQNINTKTFKLSFGFCNDGLSTFTGKVAIGVYQNGILQKTLGNLDITSLITYWGYQSYTFDGLSLSGLAEGDYQLVLVYQAQQSSVWQKVAGSAKLNNYINVTIQGTSATFSTPDLSPHLSLLEAITTASNIYLNRIGRFNLSIQNTGREFYSYVSLYIYDPVNPDNYQYLDKALLLIPQGSSQSLQLKGLIELEPGNYKVLAVYNTNNDQISENFGWLPQSEIDTLQITVLPEPEPADLILNKLPCFVNSILYAGAEQILQLEITNNGGFFDEVINAYIFPENDNSAVGELNAKEITIEQNETKTFELEGSIILEPGNYRLVIYYYQDGWTRMQPTASSLINFQLEAPTLITKPACTEDLQLASNPVKNSLCLLNTSPGFRAEILNLNGSSLGVFNTSEISVENLPSGLYLLKVYQGTKTTIVRFIKL